LQDDIASVAFWYQTLPTAPFPRSRKRTGWRLSEKTVFFLPVRIDRQKSGNTFSVTGRQRGRRFPLDKTIFSVSAFF
jgi:hypothetical protein